MVERFVASGLMKQEYDRVKLHCTLINSLFRKVASYLTNQVVKQAMILQ